MKTVQTMKGYNNYQDCSALRPHVPHSSYGTYVTLAPKVLVFPVFVQVSLWRAPGFPQEEVSTGSDLGSKTKGGASSRIQGPLWGQENDFLLWRLSGKQKPPEKVRKSMESCEGPLFLTRPLLLWSGKGVTPSLRVLRHTHLASNHPAGVTYLFPFFSHFFVSLLPSFPLPVNDLIST